MLRSLPFVMTVALLARPAAAFQIDGLTGPPTAAELASLKGAFGFAPWKGPASDTDAGPFNLFKANHGNNYVYGQSGGAVEGMIALYQVTKDRAVMDAMIYFADQMIGHRNDHFKTHDMYTGKP